MSSIGIGWLTKKSRWPCVLQYTSNVTLIINDCVGICIQNCDGLQWRILYCVPFFSYPIRMCKSHESLKRVMIYWYIKEVLTITLLTIFSNGTIFGLSRKLNQSSDSYFWIDCFLTTLKFLCRLNTAVGQSLQLMTI